jgi:hypothetical protein
VKFFGGVVEIDLEPLLQGPRELTELDLESRADFPFSRQIEETTNHVQNS